MKYMEKMWEIQGILYIQLNFVFIGSRIYMQIKKVLSSLKNKINFLFVFISNLAQNCEETVSHFT